jgi:hypothetical protein
MTAIRATDRAINTQHGGCCVVFLSGVTEIPGPNIRSRKGYSK